MAVGTYALISLASLKTYLGVTTSTDDSLMESTIDRATALIERRIGRNILAREYTEWHGATHAHSIALKQYPVNSLSGVYCGVTPALTITQAVTTDIRSTVSINSDAIGTGAPSLTLSRTAVGGTTTTTTLAFSTYTDALDLVAAINATTGFSATLNQDIRTAQLHPMAGLNLIDAPAIVTAASFGLPCTLDSSTGVITTDTHAPFSTHCGWGSRIGHFDPRATINATYTAGYSAVPDDIQQTALSLAAMLFLSRKADATVQSESLGDYSYSRSDANATGMIDSMLSDWKVIR